MKRLAPAEEQVMLRLWKIKKGSVKEIVEMYIDGKKPAYNTTSTIVRILEDKGFVKHKNKGTGSGRGYIYIPKVSKEDYAKYLYQHLLENYFDSNKEDLISQF